jgi:hypothetical protein
MYRWMDGWIVGNLPRLDAERFRGKNGIKSERGEGAGTINQESRHDAEAEYAGLQPMHERRRV